MAKPPNAPSPPTQPDAAATESGTYCATNLKIAPFAIPIAIASSPIPHSAAHVPPAASNRVAPQKIAAKPMIATRSPPIRSLSAPP